MILISNNNSINNSPKDSGKTKFIGPYSEDNISKNKEIEMKEISFQNEVNIKVNKQDSNLSNSFKRSSIKSQKIFTYDDFDNDNDYDDGIKEIKNLITYIRKNLFIIFYEYHLIILFNLKLLFLKTMSF